MGQSKQIIGSKQPALPPGLLDGLNDQQRRAVVAPLDGAVLILAGAGCGKTHVLVRRLGYCVAVGQAQEKILALTFTKSAADEMLVRVKTSGFLQDDRPMPRCTTFHALGLAILSAAYGGKTGFERIGFRARPRCIELRESLELAAKEMTAAERRALGVDARGAGELLIRYRVHPEGIASLTDAKRELLHAIEIRLYKLRRELGLWDFSDLLHGALDALRTCSEIRNSWIGNFDTVMVDEFQDTNPLQINLVRECVSQGSHLYAVGDDDQAIYGFRGADIGPTVNFQREFPPASVLKMEVNYRSSPAVLKAANRVFRNKAAHMRKILVTGTTGLERMPGPQKKRFSTIEAMAAWVSKEVERLRRNGRYSSEDCALLFRTNEIKDRVAMLIGASGMTAEPLYATVHASKGLEYPVVFVCGLDEGVFPLYRPVRNSRLSPIRRLLLWLGLGSLPVPSDCHLDEEQRLFYVALTRARHKLYLLSTARTVTYGRSRSTQPSRFLKLI